MRALSPEEEIIWNQGERLIPGRTHNLNEVIRHKCSYFFFRKALEWDLSLRRNQDDPIQIVDLGCGVGFGCRILSTLPNVKVKGVDVSRECIHYADHHYGGENITYQVDDLTQFIPAMPEFDYVISRGVFEHIHDGLRLALSSKYRYRLLFDVPYNESRGRNPHHVIFEILEKSFTDSTEMEFYFQDMEGIIYSRKERPPNPNMMICIRSHPGLPKVSCSPIPFPCQTWKPEQEKRVARRSWSRIVPWLRKRDGIL